MKIGEFAKVCNTKISVLRHYDKQNLLRPIYIDKFTGYRYYSQEQISIFFRITALKEAGFTLAEKAKHQTISGKLNSWKSATALVYMVMKRFPVTINRYGPKITSCVSEITVPVNMKSAP